MPDDEQEIFAQLPVASWKVGGGIELKFPVLSISESGGNRIVERERPYRDGAKLDDTGSKAKRWTLRVCFDNSIDEPDIDPSLPLYPEVLILITASFDQHETGDLVVPTRGKVRARAESYTREEKFEERDSAEVSFVFIEDNEDNVSAAGFNLPTIKASARRLTETTEFDAQSEGMWDGSLGELREFGSELEGIANFPGETERDIESQGKIVRATARQITRANSKANQESKDFLLDPSRSSTQRKLLRTEDMAARAEGEATRGRPRIVSYQVQGNTDIYAVAASLGQSAEDLLAINPGIDPLFLPARTVVLVFET